MSREWVYIFRIVISVLLGTVVGVERKFRYKEAGIRTHGIVALGSCLIMMVSKYGFADSAHFDASRVAAQIVSGIGFLGAGMILYKREALRGLTTAAGIWATAGIGMCVGAGLYILAAGTTVIIVIVQVVLHLPIKALRPKSVQTVRVKFVMDEDGAAAKVKQLFGVKSFVRVSVSDSADATHAVGYIRLHKILDDETIIDIMNANPFISAIEWAEEE